MRAHKNLYINDYAQLMARHVAKFRGPFPLLQSYRRGQTKFHTNFWTFLQKFVGRPLSPVRGSLTRLGHFLERVEISGRSTIYGPKYGLPKVYLNGYNLASRYPKLLEQSSPDFFRRKPEESR